MNYFIRTLADPTYPMPPPQQQQQQHQAEAYTNTDNDESPRANVFTNDVYVLNLDGQPVGYRRSYKSALRAVKRVKRDVSMKNIGYDQLLHWTEWKPKNDDVQHFVLESRPYNNILSYSKKVHDITIQRVKYFV